MAPHPSRVLPRMSLRLLPLLLLLIAPHTSAQKKPVALNDVFGNTAFSEKRVALQWMADGSSYSIAKTDSVTKARNIYRVDARSGREELLLDVSTLSMPGGKAPLAYDGYRWSESGNEIVFSLNEKRLWRRSAAGDAAVYRVREKEFIPLPVHEGGLRNVKVSPDGKTAGYVAEDDLWVYDLATKQERRLTSDAQPPDLHNGRFGWVYEEEFSIIDGWQWSPDSRRIAYWQEDERAVPEFTLTNWMPLHQELERLRYPKPGDPNPVERIGVISLESGATTWLDLGTEKDQYIPRIRWTRDPETLCVWRLNRLQNHLELLFADVRTGATRVVLEERSTTGWVEVENGAFLHFLPKKDEFLWASERDGWNHLYRYDYRGTLLGRLTEGPWEVASVAGVSPDGSQVYYLSTEASHLERRLYRVKTGGGGKKILTADAGSHAVSMNRACTLFTDSWSSVETPPITVLRDTDGDSVRTLSRVDPANYAAYAWSRKELRTIRTADSLALSCALILPPDFAPDRKYPVYFDVYGGPGTQQVRNSWPTPAAQWTAAEGFIVFQIDNRGGTGRGTAFKHAVYRQLGVWETRDYAAGAAWLATLPYVDKDRMCMWGWSYGGYISALSMLLQPSWFKTAVAIAPVADWRLYDSIYAERYMQRPQDNPAGYAAGSCLEHAAKLQGKLFLVHGGLDDNVHVQNTMQFADRLTAEGLDFDMRIFPNGNHGVVSGMKSRLGLYRSYMRFLKEALGVPAGK